MFKIHAGETLLSRERAILNTISALSGSGLNFVVVGGYAIATYRHRFSVDLDLVIPGNKVEEFRRVLSSAEYSLAFSKEIALIYGEKFERHKKEIRHLPVYVDLLINGLTSRVTDAAWGFDTILKDSEIRRLDSIGFLTPKKEMLVAMKMHSGRFSDVRDIVALVEDANHSTVKKYATRGDKNKLEKTVEKEIKILDDPHFVDGFKGVFGARFYSKDSVNNAKELLSSLIK